MGALSLFSTLLNKYTHQSDLCIGSPIAGRIHQDIEHLIGFFANTLVLRVHWDDDLTFQTLLQRARGTALEAYANQDIPFEQLVEELNPVRSLSHAPLFQVMLVLQDIPATQYRSSELNIEPMLLDTNTAMFDLTLFLVEVNDQLVCTFEYCTDLFKESTITRMGEQFIHLLQQAIENPQARLSELTLLNDADRQQLLVDWNATHADYDVDQSIISLFERQAAQTPDATALVFEDQSLTYVELNQRANQLAHYLRKEGKVTADTLVGIYLHRSLEMVVSILGTLKAGGAYVPLDPDYPQERIAFMLQDAKPKVVLTQQALVQSIEDQSVITFCMDRDWSTLSRRSKRNPSHVIQPQHLAYCIYTSGSTGKPKGVLIEHRSVYNFLLSMQDAPGITSHDTCLALTSLSFDISVLELVLPLIIGGQVVLAPKKTSIDSQQLTKLVESHNVTLLQATPTSLQTLTDEKTISKLSSLKTIISGGEVLSKDLATSLNNITSNVWNLYGPTESTIWSTYYNVDKTTAVIPIGRPIANTSVYIVDQQLQPLPIGVPGELHIGGAGLARGYLNRPELTQEKFIDNPFGPGRLYKTGDLARYLEDGTIEYLGRIDHQVKVRGFRIELGEIETALTNLPQIKEAVVVTREDVQGDNRLVGYIVVYKDFVDVSTETLSKALHSTLPEYMIPNVFVTLDQLPLTPNGKIDRKALPEPNMDRLELSGEYVPARTPIEEQLVQLWQDILHIEQAGIHDDFFSLGGHSLLTTQLVSRIRQCFEVELPLRSLFEASTIAQQGALVEDAQQTGTASILPTIDLVDRTQQLPLSFAQQRLWLLDQIEQDSAIYNSPITYYLNGKYSQPALAQALNYIIDRHEALRTFFTEDDQGNPQQIIVDKLTVTTPVIDLSDDPEQDKKAFTLCQQEAMLPFNLSEAPLLRSKILKLNEEQHVLILVMHHTITDGWSMNLFIQELTTCYQAFCEQTQPQLPTLPVQYTDYAQWQRQWLQTGIAETQLDYWKQQLADAPTLLKLPTDYPRPAIETHRGTFHTFALSSEQTQQFNSLCQRENVTLFMGALSLFSTLLNKYTHQSDLCIGSPIAGRIHQDIEHLIGFFANTLVLRVHWDDDLTFQTLLQRARGTALEAYANQDIPFEQLVEELNPVRSLSHAPLFQVMLVLQDIPATQYRSSELNIEPMLLDTNTAMFDLTLFLVEVNDQLVCTFEYCTDLFKESTITRMGEQFIHLLQQAIENPQARLSELTLLNDADRQQLLVDWNATHADYDVDQSIISLFERQAAQTPDATALVFEDQSLTYVELNQRANQLAHYLRKEGKVTADTLVGIYLHRSLEMVVSILGTLKAGGAYVPLDPDYPQERIAFMLQDAKPKVVLTQQALVQSIEDQSVITFCMDRDWSTLSRRSKRNPSHVIQPQHLAYCIYTSGSTGKPKGVLIEHRSVYNFLLSMQDAPGITSHDTCLALTSLSFDISVLELVLPLIIGGQVVLAPKKTSIDSQQLTKLVESHNVTLLQATPTSLQTLTDEKTISKLSSLKTIISGGEVLSKDLATSLNNITSNVWNLYGPTESTIWSTYYNVDKTTAVIPIGRPIANTSVYIVDQQLQPLPIGVPGELHIGGAGLARGYLNRSELTQEKFINNPFGPGTVCIKPGILPAIWKMAPLNTSGASIIKSRYAAFALNSVRSRRH